MSHNHNNNNNNNNNDYDCSNGVKVVVVVKKEEEEEEEEANWKRLSADVVLEIFSFLKMDQSCMMTNMTHGYSPLPFLYGYFADDPNRQLYFLFSHFSLRFLTGKNFSDWHPIFRHAAQFSVKWECQQHKEQQQQDDDDDDDDDQEKEMMMMIQIFANSLRKNWKLQKFVNESSSHSSFSSCLVQSLNSCHSNLKHFSSHSVSIQDLNHLSSFPNLESITVRMVLPVVETSSEYHNDDDDDGRNDTMAVVVEEDEEEEKEEKTVEKLFDLQRVLAQNWKNLSYLELNTLGTRGQHADLRSILGGNLEALFNQSSIKTLVLANQHIQAEDLEHFWMNETIQTLDLSSCTFADRATMQNLAANSHVKNLRLIGCSLNSSLASCLFDSLSGAHLHELGVLASLEKLSLAVNPQITSRLTKLVSSISKNELVLPKLKHLNMSGCKLQSIGAVNVTRLVAKSVKVLYFKSCAITDEGFIGILKACPELMSISLCDNKIQLKSSNLTGDGNGGKEELVMIENLCPNMRRIKLQRNDIKSDGAAWLANQFSSHEKFWSLSMDFNKRLGDEGAIHLLSLTSLKRLSLNNCHLTDRFILHRLHSHLSSFDNNEQSRYSVWHPNLVDLCLIGNDISDEGARVLFSSPFSRLLLSNNRRLTEESVKLLLSSNSLQKIWMENLPLVSREVKQSIMDHVKKYMAEQIISIRL